MASRFEKLIERINIELAGMQIYVTDLWFKTEGKQKILTIELDKVGGIDLDTIVSASQIVNPIVDEMDLIDDTYILDIISKERKKRNE